MSELAIADEPRRKPRRLAPPKPLTLTVGDTSKITGLGNTKIYELINQGRLKSVAIGRRRLVLYSSIEELLLPAAA
jgi:excisionase family DNA binding protein